MNCEFVKKLLFIFYYNYLYLFLILSIIMIIMKTIFRPINQALPYMHVPFGIEFKISTYRM